MGSGASKKKEEGGEAALRYAWVIERKENVRQMARERPRGEVSGDSSDSESDGSENFAEKYGGLVYDEYGLFLNRNIDFGVLSKGVKNSCFLDIDIARGKDKWMQFGKEEEWKLHGMYGAVFTSENSDLSFDQGDEKPADGVADPQFFNKKKIRDFKETLFNSSMMMGEEEIPKSFKPYISRFLADNNLVALSLKGNQESLPSICIDYHIAFGNGFRVALLTEGEGPFASQVETRMTSVGQQLLCHEDRSRVGAQDEEQPFEGKRRGSRYEAVH